MDKIKQVIVVRKDLKMGSGKIAAQVAHASMGVLLNAGTYTDDSTGTNFSINLSDNKPLAGWMMGAFTKVCVSCDSEQQLIELEAAASTAGVLNCLITDSGLTKFNGVPTKTCLAIGPANAAVLNLITGHLKLL